MEKFVDREKELEILEKEYKSEGSSFVIIYGRRRVGKTTLISKFINNKKALFFLASRESEYQNRLVFRDRAAEFIGSELLKNVDVKNWDIIFKEIMNTSFDSKPIIVFDEFQYIGKSEPSFPSIFQRIWEEQLKNKSVMVILCGSLISLMEQQTLEYSSPLYGRRTAQIKLKQIPFKYYYEFFEKRSSRELVEMYSLTGGVAKYIEQCVNSKDVYSAIRDNVINRSSYLYEEPFFLLQQEVSEIGSYFSIIRAIAMGNNKLSAISNILAIKATSLSIYLKTLIDLDILEREVPITEDNPEKSKMGLYKIKDNFIRFWFMFIYPNRSYIESNNEQVVFDKIKKSFITDHVAFVYEDICREKMWDLCAKNKWPFYFTKVGRWWNNKTEIDLIALDPNENNIIFGECKYWHNNKVGINIFNELQLKSETVDWNKGNRKNWYILFAMEGFSDDLIILSKQRKDLILIEGI